MGWLSALGRDLGLNLDDTSMNSGHRCSHSLGDIAAKAYDFVLEYNPMIVDDDPDSYNGVSGRDMRGHERRGNFRGGLHIDTQSNQGVNVMTCRQPSILNDRLYAANVEVLSSMIQVGILSSWLTTAPASARGENGRNDSGRSVDRLCQKLFFIIETRTRLRRSTNQNTATGDSGDSEAVCASSLSLLLLALPKHEHHQEPASLSTSFRQMGTSTGTIEDLLQSPLVRKIIEMALSWEGASQKRKNGKGHDVVAKSHATSNAIYVLSDICMAGGASLLSSDYFRQRLEGCLGNIIDAVSERGQSRVRIDNFDPSSIAACLLFLLQLHVGSPIFVRKFLKNYIVQCSSVDDDGVLYFVAGLLNLCSSVSKLH